MTAVAHRAVAARAMTDDNDHVVIPAIGPAGAVYPVGKMDAHRRGVQHIAVSVFIFAGSEILIQRRAAGKYHSGLQWANACCSHPNWDEPIAAAAHRRLFEELGIDLPLAAGRVIDYRADVGGGLIENERVHLFSGIADRRTLVIAPDPQEVSETRWATRADLLREAGAAPDSFAPWFRIYLDRWAELGF
jgi:isopentenyl-diphosphate delta-isomerase